MNFRLFLSESIANRLRKERLKAVGVKPVVRTKEDIETLVSDWIILIKFSDIGDLNLEELEIRKDYDYLKQHKGRKDANEFLDRKAEEYKVSVIRQTINKDHTLVVQNQGVEVYTDGNVSVDFSPGTYNSRMLNHTVNQFLNYIRDILPNRRPKFLLTDVKKHAVTRVLDQKNRPSRGAYFQKMIYIDQYQFEDPKTFIHEYAHYLADLVGTQTERMLFKAYDSLIADYFRKIKKKRVPLHPGEHAPIEVKKISEALREKISRKLGFPSGYGLLDEHEFFAVLIESWKDLPNTPTTYRLKTMVKNVITRL